MKPLLLTIALLFSTPSWAEWNWEYVNNYKDTEFYIDFDMIFVDGEYVYYSTLANFAEPKNTNFSDILALSSITDYKGNCDLFRVKDLRGDYYAQSMGKEKIILPESKGLFWWKVERESELGERLKKVCQKAYS